MDVCHTHDRGLLWRTTHAISDVPLASPSKRFQWNRTAVTRDPILVDLALQGGGSHGAFTWGVLDRLLEEPWLGIDGISGTSAGAMNAAVLADGYAKAPLDVPGHRDRRRTLLGRRLFWQSHDHASHPRVRVALNRRTVRDGDGARAARRGLDNHRPEGECGIFATT